MIQERHNLLAAAIKDPHHSSFIGNSGLQGMLTPLLPGLPCLSESGFSKVGQTLHDIQEVYDVAIGRQVCNLLGATVHQDLSNNGFAAFAWCQALKMELSSAVISVLFSWT